MKKTSKKLDLVRLIGGCASLIGFILLVIGAFLTGNARIILAIIGFVLFLAGGFVFTARCEKHTMAKMLLFLILATAILTWLIPYGFFNGLDFYDYGLERVGLVNLGLLLHSSINWNFESVIFLFVVAGFYGILGRTNGYKKLVNTIANKLKKYPLVVAIITSLIITALTSMFTDTFAMFIIVPFFVSILLSMKLDKLTTFAITFGSMLIGAIGATYGTESLLNFSYNLSVEKITTGIAYRLIILLVAYFLFNFFICMRIKKVNKEKVNEEVENTLFTVENTKDKTSMIPALVILLVVFIITILGFIDWKTNFNITVFEDLHNSIYNAQIGDVPIMQYILSQTNSQGNTEALAFGTFMLRTIEIVLVLASLLMGLLYRVKFNEMLDAAYEGIKKMFKPIIFYFGAGIVYLIIASSPFTFTLCNWILNAVDGFNPYLTTVVASITSLFHLDTGFTAYYLGSFLSTAYASDFNLVYTIFVSMFGLVHMIAPTSIFMLIGLSLMKVDYKDWLKYIWLFVIGMLVILLVLFTVL